MLRWTRRGDLPAIRLPGGAIRYRHDELEAWLAASGDAGTRSASYHDRRRPGRTLLAGDYGVGVAGLTTTPRTAAAPEDEEH